MKEVLYDKKWLDGTKNTPLYYMYRDLYRPEDRKTIKQNRLSYDITVIPPKKLGKEWVKTKGHYHPKVNSMTYPELYGVLEGKAHYLLQKRKGGKIVKTVLVEAKEGEKVIIPPNYGHITINPSKEKLKMANWVCRDFESIYKPILERGGAAWFELIDGFQKNENYENVPELEKFRANKNDPFSKNIYDLVKEPKKLNFLTNPEENKKIFEKLRF